jgi:hypothetical protein
VRWALPIFLLACGPGVGRPPDDRDAGQPAEAGEFDAEGYFDALVIDTGIGEDVGVFVPDTGEVTRYPFSGIFGILNDNDSLFAREVDDRLMIIIGRPPYIYTGTIDEAGNVDTVSGELTRSGCATARVTGTYDRVAATYELRHQTCSSIDGSPLDSMLRGGFAQDFFGASGNYMVTATLIQDLTGCAMINQPQPATHGVSILNDGTVIVFGGIDIVSEPGVYVGSATGGGSGFSVVQEIDTSGSQQVSMSGMFSQPNANDPIQLTGERDVWQPEGNCSYRVMYMGERGESP